MRRALVVAAAISVSGCATEDVVVATFDADAGGDEALSPEAGGCTTNDDCGETSFCAKSSCSDATGVCELRPAVCDGQDARACGCDGVTYWNDCLRAQFGVAASTSGECRVGAAMCSPDASSCPVPGASCERLLGSPAEMCGPDIPGACWVVPIDPSTCTGPGGGPPGRWQPCDAPPGCVDTCTAIQSGLPSHPADSETCP